MRKILILLLILLLSQGNSVSNNIYVDMDENVASLASKRVARQLGIQNATLESNGDVTYYDNKIKKVLKAKNVPPELFETQYQENIRKGQY